MSGSCFGLLLAIALIVAAIIPLPNEGNFRGFPIPVWGLVLELCIGLAVGFISLRSILRGENKEKPPTDEDITKAKSMLEKLYLKEHGTLPEYPEESKEDEKREQKS